MKRFEIITESDARVLEPGSTVLLVPGGIVTPLARDTLRERRIVVVRDDLSDAEVAALAPVANVRTLAIGCDHTGVALKNALVAHFRARGLQVEDLGVDRPDPVDYPDVAERVATMVAAHEADAGVIIDGAGIGSAIAANKIRGIRAAMCPDETIARYAREHNGAHIATIGASMLDTARAVAIVERFVATPMREPRYLRRLAKIERLERRP